MRMWTAPSEMTQKTICSTAAQQTAILWCTGPCCIWSYPKSLPSAIDGWDSSTITATNAASTNVSIVMFCATGGVVFSTDDNNNDDDHDADDVEEEDDVKGPVTETMCCEMTMRAMVTVCERRRRQTERVWITKPAGMPVGNKFSFQQRWQLVDVLLQHVQLPFFFFISWSCSVHTHTVAVIVEADNNNKHSGTLQKGAMSVMLCSIVRLEKEEESQWRSERWGFNADSKPYTTSRIPFMSLLLSELCSLLKGRWLQIVSFIYVSMWCKHPWHDKSLYSCGGHVRTIRASWAAIGTLSQQRLDGYRCKSVWIHVSLFPYTLYPARWEVWRELKPLPCCRFMSQSIQCVSAVLLLCPFCVNTSIYTLGKHATLKKRCPAFDKKAWRLLWLMIVGSVYWWWTIMQRFMHVLFEINGKVLPWSCFVLCIIVITSKVLLLFSYPFHRGYVCVLFVIVMSDCCVDTLPPCLTESDQLADWWGFEVAISHVHAMLFVRLFLTSWPWLVWYVSTCLDQCFVKLDLMCLLIVVNVQTFCW